jgi:hypothetical protein
MRGKSLLAGFVWSVMILSPIVTMAAEPVKVTGEIIDTFCYSQLGARGESHRQCTIDCVKAGIPAGILEDGTNKVYVLLPNKDKMGLPKEVLE